MEYATEPFVIQVRQSTLKSISLILRPATLPTLSEETDAPTLGYLAHLLLRTSEAEVKAGPKGSKAVRLEALKALELLIELLGRARGEAVLGFLLPGLFGGLSQQILAASKTFLTILKDIK